MIDTNILLFGFPALALVAGLVELIKVLLKDFDREIPKYHLPLLSIGVAVLLFVVSGGYSLQAFFQNILFGVIVGLSASGGYDVVTKSLLQEKEE